ncbi:rhomboid family intramembrane serine protease [archaeon]|nr:rhomboid family intramembrane serine protease [archaeon]
MSNTMWVKVYSDLALNPSIFTMSKSYYTLITYQFLHLNFQHLISNMFALFSIGRAVESEIGSTKFGLSYLLAGIFSGILHIVFNQGSDIMVIGASGAVFGALALLLLLMPFKFTSAMIIPMPGFVLGISMLVIEVSAILYNTDVWVAHDVHLFGFIAGGLAAFGIDYDRALRGLIISVIILIGLYYWAFYIEGIMI